MKPSPLYNDTVQFYRWLDKAIAPASIPGRRAHEHALDLLNEVTLALHGLDREEALYRADRALACLRATLRVCHEVGALTEPGVVHAAKLLDPIGRQLGGWRRSLGDHTA